MVAQRLANLSDSDLQLIEDLLSKEFANENEKSRTWRAKNGYAKPFEKAKRLLVCMNAIRAQRDLAKKIEFKW